MRAHSLHGMQCAFSPESSLFSTSALHAGLQLLLHISGMTRQSLEDSFGAQASLRTGRSSVLQSSPRCGICRESAELRMVEQQLAGNNVDDAQVIRQSLQHPGQMAILPGQPSAEVLQFG